MDVNEQRLVGYRLYNIHIHPNLVTRHEFRYDNIQNENLICGKYLYLVIAAWDINLIDNV